jgi:adenylate kinase
MLRRGDDTAESILRRLRIYRDEVEPVISYYRSSGRLREIDGTNSPETVYGELKNAIMPGRQQPRATRE